MERRVVIRQTARGLLAAGLVGYLVLRGAIDWTTLGGAIAQPGALASGALLVAAGLFVTVPRWLLLLRCRGFDISFRDVFRLSAVGLFFSNVIPGATGGDLVKCYYLARERGRLAEAAASVAVDRAIGMATLVGIGLVSLASRPDLVMPGSDFSRIAWILLGVLGGVLLGAALLFSRTVRGWRLTRLLLALPGGRTLGNIHAAFHAYRSSRGALLAATGLSVLSQCLIVAGFWRLSGSLGAGGISPADALFVVPVGLSVNALPITPMGLGVGETAFEWLFRLFGSTMGSEAMLLWRVVVVLLSLIGLYYYVRGRKGSAPVPKEGDGEGEGC